jgi:hypothetical protein
MTLGRERVDGVVGGSWRLQYVVSTCFSNSVMYALERGVLVLSPMVHSSTWDVLKNENK